MEHHGPLDDGRRTTTHPPTLQPLARSLRSRPVRTAIKAPAIETSQTCTGTPSPKTIRPGTPNYGKVDFRQTSFIPIAPDDASLP